MAIVHKSNSVSGRTADRASEMFNRRAQRKFNQRLGGAPTSDAATKTLEAIGKLLSADPTDASALLGALTKTLAAAGLSDDDDTAPPDSDDGMPPSQVG